MVRGCAVAGDGMGRHEKVKEQVCSGKSDANVDFNDLCKLVAALGSESASRAAITYSQDPRFVKSLICSRVEADRQSPIKSARCVQ
jgi:hypothetical protein